MEEGAEDRVRHGSKSMVRCKLSGMGFRYEAQGKGRRNVRRRRRGARRDRVLLALSEMFTDMETYNAPMRLAASIQTICSMQCGMSKISRSPRSTPHARNTYAATTLWWSSCRREIDGHAAASAPGCATCSLNASSGTVTKAFSQPAVWRGESLAFFKRAESSLCGRGTPPSCLMR